MKNFFTETAGITLIRILFGFVCLLFFFPLFYAVSRNTVTGFDTIFASTNYLSSGNPLALVAFMYPFTLIILSLLEFFYKKLYTLLMISAIVGFLLTLIYVTSQTFTLCVQGFLFVRHIFNVHAGMTFWSILMFASYIAIFAVSITCKRAEKKGI
jgi:hypothetical protein